METKYLLDGEKIITQSDGNIITLTNLRVRYTDKAWGEAFIDSIMLEKISSIEVRFQSKIIYLILGILTLIIGVGLIFLLLYFMSRKHYLIIYSCGEGKIEFHTKGMKTDAILNFINQVEAAIKNRIEELK